MRLYARMNGQQHNSKVRRAARRTTRLGNNGIGLNSTATNGNNETSTDPIESLNNPLVSSGVGNAREVSVKIFALQNL